MEILDDFRHRDANAPNIFSRRTTLWWGIIGGVVYEIINEMNFRDGHIMETEKYSWPIWFGSIGVFAFTAYMAIKKHRDKELEGYISLGRCLSIGSWLALTAAFVASFIRILNFADNGSFNMLFGLIFYMLYFLALYLFITLILGLLMKKERPFVILRQTKYYTDIIFISSPT